MLIVKQLMGEKVGFTEQTADLLRVRRERAEGLVEVRGQRSDWAAKPQRGNGK